MTKKVRAYAKASAANLTVGFDLIGACLSPLDKNVILGDIVEVFFDDSLVDIYIKQEGKFASKLPSNPKKNIVYDAFLLFKDEVKKKGYSLRPISMTLSKNLPVCSGLGSSASSVVASICALNALCDNILTKDEELKLMGILEGQISGSIHYDNVAPCFYGGLQLITNDKKSVSRSLPTFDDWIFVSCFPGIKVSTSKAREILPKEYTRDAVITYGRNLSTFIQALYTKDEELALETFNDVIAEPYREGLITGYKEAKEYALNHEAKAMGISGSGSSIFAIYKDMDKALSFKEYLEKNFICNEDGFCHICKIDSLGCEISVS